MSTNNQRVNTGSQATTDYDLSKIFIWNNRYHSGQYTNSVYDPETLSPGQVLGRISATNKLAKCFSTSTDGSQYPIGVVAETLVVVEGSTVNLTFCNKGDVVADKLIFEGNDGLQAVVSGKTMFDMLQAAGLNIVNNTEQTDYDN